MQSTHLTKLNSLYQVNDKFSTYFSLIYYWGFPGSEDYADFTRSGTFNSYDPSFLTTSDGSKKAFQRSVFANTGFTYQVSERTKFTATAHNLLGWFNDDLNKRNNIRRFGSYREEAPSFTLTMSMKF